MYIDIVRLIFYCYFHLYTFELIISDLIMILFVNLQPNKIYFHPLDTPGIKILENLFYHNVITSSL